MPSLINPPDMPEDVVGAIETMGNRARSDILRLLIQEGPLSTTQIAERVADSEAVPLRMVRRHLLAMEDARIVQCDLPRESRHGRIPMWTADIQPARELAGIWISFLEGETKTLDAEGDAAVAPEQ